MDKNKVQSFEPLGEISQDEYSIWNYLKEHTNLLIAAVSAMIAVFSFFMNMAIYLNIGRYLDYWEIDALQITFSTSNQVYNVFIAFLFHIITLCTTFFISSTYDAYNQRQRILICIKRGLRKIKKNDKKVCKDLKAEKKRIAAIKITPQNEKDINEQIQRIAHIEKENVTDKDHVSNIKKIYKKTQKRNRLLLLVSNIICFMAMFFGSLIFMTSMYTDNILYTAIFYAAIYVGINSALYGLINYFIAIRIVNKSKENFLIYCEENISRQKELPIEKAFCEKLKCVRSDKIIKNICIQLIIITFAFLLIFSFGGYSNAKKQREFYYVTSEEETYAVIYNNGQDLTLKKAYIDGDTIIIDLSIQKTISSKEVVLTKKNFETVEIIPIK